MMCDGHGAAEEVLNRFWGFREPPIIHFGGQANLFDSGRRGGKATLASTKADLPSLPKSNNLLLAAQKQLLELPYIIKTVISLSKLANKYQKYHIQN